MHLFDRGATRTTRRPLTLAVAVALALVLAADVLVVVVRTSRSGDGGVVPSATALDSGPPANLAPPEHLSEDLPELRAFVERTRGLQFKDPVDVEFLSGDEFDERLRGDDDFEPLEEDDFFIDFLRALGLVRGGLDAEAVTGAAGTEHILGYYDPESEDLYVRGVASTPFLRSVVVHELTHVLEDQHFDLLRPELDERGDESGESFRALVEGSASAVENRYLESLPPADRRDAAREQESAVPSGDDVPEGVLRLLAYPYVVGPHFVEALRATGGTAALDAAMENPPVTSEQVLHPERYRAGEGPLPVAHPRADGRATDRGSLGEIMLYALLLEPAGQEVARRAAEGWGGDRYVAWDQGARACLRWNVVMDGPAETAELLSALRAWTARNPGATVSGANPVVIANCA